MKVELQCGDKIAIPEGCKAIVKDGSVVFEKEEKEQEFEDGDVLYSTYMVQCSYLKKRRKSVVNIFTLITTLTVAVIKVGIANFFSPRHRRGKETIVRQYERAWSAVECRREES